MLTLLEQKLCVKVGNLKGNMDLIKIFANVGLKAIKDESAIRDFNNILEIIKESFARLDEIDKIKTEEDMKKYLEA